MKILITSTDSREPLWGLFDKLFTHFWADCPFERLILSNHKDSDIIKTTKCGEDNSFVRKLYSAIKELEGLILIMHDDCFLNKKVDTAKILSLCDHLVEDENIGAIHLGNHAPAHFCFDKWKISGIGYFDKDTSVNNERTLSIQDCILFKEEYLIRLLGEAIKNIPIEKDIGWQGAHEFIFAGTKIASKLPEDVLGVIGKPFISYIDGYHYGKLAPKAISLLNSLSIEVPTLNIRDTNIYPSRMKLKIKKIHDKRGDLFVLQPDFDVKNTYWITGVTEQRGGHAHKKTKQIIICVKGTINLRIKADGKEKSLTLHKNDHFFQDNNVFVWLDFSTPEDIVLVLADSVYDPNDYIYE